MQKSLMEQAKTHVDRRQIPDAIRCLTDHLNDDFHDAEALFMLGACWLDQKKPGLAAALLRQAIEIRARRGHVFPEALKNLGACFKVAMKLDAAREVWKLALEVAPNNAERAQILSNLGGLHINQGSAHKALEYFDEALRVDPNCHGAAFNRGMAHLELGNWRQGWIDYHVGFKTQDRVARIHKGLPQWDGSPGRKVIAWGEQGIGDEIMFASMLPDLIRVSERVIFECHPRLMELFKRSFPGVEIHGTRKQQTYVDWLDDCDADSAICLSSLGLFFRNEDSEFPGRPYLAAAPMELPAQRPLRIGISWVGGTKETNAEYRSIPLDQWRPILEALPEAEFYSLQYTDDAAAQICELEEKTGLRVRHFPNWVTCTDYDKTATFVSSMDLVITVCTSIHHLANAIGTPTWTLVPSRPAWRYGAKGHLWYRHTSRFIRQDMGVPWSRVIAATADELRLWAERREAA